MRLFALLIVGVAFGANAALAKDTPAQLHNPLATTDCFEKAAWDKWFQFFAEGRFNKSGAVDIPKSPLEGKAIIWKQFITKNGTETWTLLDDSILERKKDGSVFITPKGGKPRQLCPK